jgi:Amt family ammonium transporter
MLGENFVMIKIIMLMLIALVPELAYANEKIAENHGDTAWLLASTALVMIMTPGLALFYGSMTGRKVVDTLTQNFFALSFVGVLWIVVGYSLAFSDGNEYLGDLRYLLFKGVDGSVNTGFTIPHVLFACFQMMFAVITPVLMTGAVSERITMKSWIAIMCIWSVVVYCPIAHWLWSNTGFLAKQGSLDFAGGFVVHMSSGFSALVLALLIPKKKASEESKLDNGMILLGTTLLWFGWFGFNAGSALTGDAIASNAFATTYTAAAVCMLTYTFFECMIDKKPPSLFAACCGAVAGLVAITPAAGYVSVQSAILIGLITGFVGPIAQKIVKEKLGINDTLDVFACHGVCGLLGSLLTGVFASAAVNSGGKDGLVHGSAELLRANINSSLVVGVYSIVATFIIYKVVAMFMKVQVED